MSNTTDKKLYKVDGYKPVIGQRVDYYTASTESAVLSHIKSVPPEAGGFVKYSVSEIEALPPEVFIACPHCEERVINPSVVMELP